MVQKAPSARPSSLVVLGSRSSRLSSRSSSNSTKGSGSAGPLKNTPEAV